MYKRKDNYRLKLHCAALMYCLVNEPLLFFFSSFLQRQNIPKDYKIPVHYVPEKEVSWLH